jgi:N-acetylglucosaminyl-diphospho-decaprenol L-rhamnosyltransferase
MNPQIAGNELETAAPGLNTDVRPGSVGVKGTAIVVTYNSGQCIESCLDALLAQTGWEIVVIDNASKDNTVSLARKFEPRVRVVANGDNKGWSGGQNQGVKLASGDVCVLVNPDAIPEPGALDRLVAALSRYDAGAAGGILLLEGDEIQKGNIVRRFPTLSRSLAEVLLLNNIWPLNPLNRSWRLLDMDYSVAQSIDGGVSGACMAFRRTTWEKVGGFDEGFYPCWYDDQDFNAKLDKAGLKRVYEPAAVFRHLAKHSVGQLSLYQRQLMWYANYVRFFRKHQGWWQTAMLRGGMAAGLLVRAAFSLVKPPGRIGRVGAASAYLQVAWKAAVVTVDPRSFVGFDRN